MAERLTECIDSHLLDNGEMVKEYSLNSKIELNHFSCMDIPNAVYDKLGELEDILEKYDLEVEELEELLDDNKYTQNVVVKQLVELQNAKNDENTWKRACELACEELNCSDNYGCKTYTIPPEKMPQYFYQQAKKENKKVQIHYCTNDETNKILGDIKIKDDFSTTMQNLAKMYAGTLKDLDTAEDKDN